MNYNPWSYHRGRYALMAAMLLMAASLGTLQAQQLITPESIVGIRRADDVQVSPDDRRVVFTVSDLAAGNSGKAQPTSKVRVVATSGTGTPQQPKINLSNTWSPRWAPDSRKLAFLSDEARSGAQLYLMDGDAIAPKKLTTVSGDVESVQMVGRRNNDRVTEELPTIRE